MKKLLIYLPFLLIGCTISQPVVYRTDDLSAPLSTKPIPIMIDIKILSDNRNVIKENGLQFSDPRQTKIDGKIICINSEKHYKKDSVVSQMTRMMVEHFNKARLFKMTFYSQSKFSSYYMTGTLNNFYGEQEFSKAAAVGAQFGLIGALATAGIKTPGKIIIEIADLKLFTKDGTLVKDFGSFYREYKDDFKADGYCWCMYFNINEKLKDFNSGLIEKIRSDLADIKFD